MGVVTELDFEAIADEAEAVVFAQHHKELCGCDRWPDGCPHFPKDKTLFSVNAYNVVVAAAPLIEKAVRTAASDELVASANEIPEGERITGPRATRYRTLMAAARKVLPPLTTAEITDALNRGDYMVCTAADLGEVES